MSKNKTEDKVVGTFTVDKNVTEEDISNVLANSFTQGGSGYWMGIDNTTEGWEQRPKGVSLSEWATQMLIDGKTIHFYDVEGETDHSEEKWTLTLDKLVDGFKLNQKERPWDADHEQGDATTADCIVQYGVFGEIVFG